MRPFRLFSFRKSVSVSPLLKGDVPSRAAGVVFFRTKKNIWCESVTVSKTCWPTIYFFLREPIADCNMQMMRRGKLTWKQNAPRAGQSDLRLIGAPWVNTALQWWAALFSPRFCCGNLVEHHSCLLPLTLQTKTKSCNILPAAATR